MSADRLGQERGVKNPAHRQTLAAELKAQEDGFDAAGRHIGFVASLEAWETALATWIPGAWRKHRRRKAKAELVHKWELVLALLIHGSNEPAVARDLARALRNHIETNRG